MVVAPNIASQSFYYIIHTMKHRNNLKSDKAFVKKYFPILSPSFPDFLTEYINTPAMQRLRPNSISCGCLNATK
jgi:hypothetical protein